MSDPAKAGEVFISYSSKDRERVRILVDALVRQGIPVWWDQFIVPGQNWENELEQALHRARAVIVLWSQHSVISDEVKAEANYALKQRNLIPALLDGAAIPFRYRRTQTPDLSHWDGAEDDPSFRALLAALAVAPAAPPDPDSLAKSKRRVTLIAWTWILVPSLLLGSLTAALMLRKAPTEVQLPPTRQPGDTRVNRVSGMKEVWIPPGTFTMGCSERDTECHENEKPAHPVTITKGFWIGQTEVTVEAYKRYVIATGKSMPPEPAFLGTVFNLGWEDMGQPILNVSSEEAAAYCAWAGEMSLPTEAQWEYAARAGSRGAQYGWLEDIAWYKDNSGDRPKGVGKKTPNAWMLHDMLGNAWEWTADWHGRSTTKRRKVGIHKARPVGLTAGCAGGLGPPVGAIPACPSVAATYRWTAISPSAFGARGSSFPLTLFSFPPFSAAGELLFGGIARKSPPRQAL